MKSLLSESGQTQTAASVAPEDLRRGDFVAILSVTYEYPSFLWCCDSAMSPREDVVRVQRTGADDGMPLKVKAICLPFVFAKDASGKHRTLDVRLCRLARLSSNYARKVWKRLGKK